MTGFRLARALISVSGPDREGFLNNLLTQNVEGLTGVRYGALLTPQGKLIADMFVWTHEQAIVIETDPSFGETLAQRLRLYKLRAEVGVEFDAELGVLASTESFEGALADPRAPDGGLGYRRLAPRREAGLYPDEAGALRRQALLAGVPNLALDVKSEEVFAAEALLEELHGVDFHKGCFVGQENVSRMKRRATTRRKLCRIGFDGDGLGFGAPIRAGDAEIGSVRSAEAGCGIALLRLDRALEAQERGQKLFAGEREIRLDPPTWLILPQGKGEAAAGDD
jgi:folate-binding protein YgfZ